MQCTGQANRVGYKEVGKHRHKGGAWRRMLPEERELQVEAPAVSMPFSQQHVQTKSRPGEAQPRKELSRQTDMSGSRWGFSLLESYRWGSGKKMSREIEMLYPRACSVRVGKAKQSFSEKVCGTSPACSSLRLSSHATMRCCSVRCMFAATMQHMRYGRWRAFTPY